MELDAVYLDVDDGTLNTVRVAGLGVHSTLDEEEESDEENWFYEAICFYVSEDGYLAYVESRAAFEKYGHFLGFVPAGSDPEVLRPRAMELLCSAADCGRPS